jgi:hypothetical protein
VDDIAVERSPSPHAFGVDDDPTLVSVPNPVPKAGHFNRAPLGKFSRAPKGIGYLDLTPMLVAAAKRGVISYYTDDSHWSPEGHQIAAEAIGQYLSETDSHSPTPDRVFESNWSGAGK